MSTFVVGKTYTTRSVCDHDCIISATIVKRTAKTVTLVSGTTPTCAFVIQHSDDDSTYTDLATCLTASVTAAGEYFIPVETSKAYVRLKYTIAGTTPSFTTQADITMGRP